MIHELSDASQGWISKTQKSWKPITTAIETKGWRVSFSHKLETMKGPDWFCFLFFWTGETPGSTRLRVKTENNMHWSASRWTHRGFMRNLFLSLIRRVRTVSERKKILCAFNSNLLMALKALTLVARWTFSYYKVKNVFFHSGGGALIARCILMLYDPVYRPHNLFSAHGWKRPFRFRRYGGKDTTDIKTKQKNRSKLLFFFKLLVVLSNKCRNISCIWTFHCFIFKGRENRMLFSSSRLAHADLLVCINSPLHDT